MEMTINRAMALKWRVIRRLLVILQRLLLTITAYVLRLHMQNVVIHNLNSHLVVKHSWLITKSMGRKDEQRVKR